VIRKDARESALDIHSRSEKGFLMFLRFGCLRGNVGWLGFLGWGREGVE